MQRTPRYNVALMVEDIAAKGWRPVDLAREAKVAASSVSRFLSGAHQTATMAARLSAALGRAVDHYLIRAGR